MLPFTFQNQCNAKRMGTRNCQPPITQNDSDQLPRFMRRHIKSSLGICSFVRIWLISLAFITQTKTPQLIGHFFAQPQLLLALSISRFLWLVIYGTSLLADATTPYLEPLQDSSTAQCCPNSSSLVIQRHHEFYSGKTKIN